MAEELTPAQQRQRDYDLAHPTEFSCSGLNAFTITGIVVITFAVCLRFWSRKLARIHLKSDDYLLLLALILTIGAQSMAMSNIFNAHWCYHQSTLTKTDFSLGGKQWYAWNLMYTTSYPIARISLTLLYHRIFLQSWIRGTCWFLIFCYTGYAVGSFIADICQFWPIESSWDLDVKRTHAIDLKTLYLANTGFNIATDAILLFLPLVAIWDLRMTRWRKIGLGLIFCLGCLTVIASIFRLSLYHQYNTLDPNYTLAPIQWWTHAEMDLGILCPCFVTMQPLLHHGFVYFSSQLSPLNRSRLERATGVPTTTPPPRIHGHENGSSHTQFTSNKSLRSKHSRIEDGRQWYDMEDMPYPLPQGVGAESGDPVRRSGSQEAALAVLDPRAKTSGSHAQVGRGPGGDVPENGIGVAKNWRLHSEHADG